MYTQRDAELAEVRAELAGREERDASEERQRNELEQEIAQLRDALQQARVEADRRAPRRDLVPLHQAVTVYGDSPLPDR